MASGLTVETKITLAILTGAVFIALALVAFAQPAGISFPIPELGNCGSESECRAYCDQADHIRGCIEFAQAHNLIPPEEASRAKKFADIAATGGPGGCRSPEECEAYCSDFSHIEECLAFAERIGMPKEAIAEARKVLRARAEGAEFPGNCKTKDECQHYCFEQGHMEECLAFGEKTGLMDREEAAMARRMLELMQRGETPGGCQSPQACQDYCQGGEHFEECIAFAERMGFVKPQEAEAFRKTGGKGPGGCNSRESCEAFCNNPANQETCINFAKEHGFIREEELRAVEEGRRHIMGGLENAPPEVRECLKQHLGTHLAEDIREGKILPGPEIGDRVRQCFEEHFRSRVPPGTGEGMHEFPQQPPQGFVPPSGTGAFPQPPAGIAECVRQLFGQETAERLSRGEFAPTTEMQHELGMCLQQHLQQP